MKIDFSKVVIKDINGKNFPMDEVRNARQAICNQIYQTAKDIPLMELAVKLYHADGEVELTDKEVRMWEKELETVPAFIRQGFLDLL